MSELSKTPAESTVEHSSHFPTGLSLTWLLPFGAILFTAWILWDTYTSRGVLVDITFAKAGGVIAGETRVRRNDVDVGEVESVRLSEGLNSVVVSVRMDPKVAPYLDTNARFWIVNARINTTEISGLGTLLSGSYIEVDWDHIAGERQSEYIGLNEPPLSARDTPGLRLTLNADEAGYIYVGSPVFHRQIEVGRVERRRLSDDALNVQFDIFIEAPYHNHVYPETRFYGVSGVEGIADSTGVSVRVESIAALFTGGIAFDNPVDVSKLEPVFDTREPYKLFGSRTEAKASLFDGEDDERYRFFARFPGSVKGLREGAPIEYNGMRVGRVVSVTVNLPESLGDENSATVVLQFQPARFGLAGVSLEHWHSAMNELVKNGLRVQLASGNLLTGSLVVKLISVPDAGEETIHQSNDIHPTLPVVPTNVDGVTADVETLIKNLSQLPLNALVVNATGLLQDARKLIANPDMASLPSDLSSSMSSIAAAASQVEIATADLPAMIESLAEASRNANVVLEGVSPDSEIYYELSSAVRELRIAAKSIAAFAELLEEHPNAILTGR